MRSGTADNRELCLGVIEVTSIVASLGVTSLQRVVPMSWHPGAPGIPPQLLPHWPTRCHHHLAAKQFELVLLRIVETAVKRLGRFGDLFKFIGASSHVAGRRIHTLDGGHAGAVLHHL